MSSPFLKVPESEWVASNAWAFALRDRYPVSPGHTLVIPRRLVATWFEATQEEQQALFALVDEVKRNLDASARRPDDKPLLLLLMLARIQGREPRLITFKELEPKLLSLLRSRIPQQSAHSASYPFWRLKNDGIWEIVVENPAALVKRKSNTDPTLTSLRRADAQGGFLKDYDELLRNDPALLRRQAVQILLGLFPKETHQTLLNQTSLRLD